jgi:FkbM family methyltransferase
MTIDLPKSAIDRRVWHESIYQLHAREFMLSQTRQFIDLKKNVVDVGAAVGMYSYHWATTPGFEGRVFAFEAVEAVFKQLQKTADERAPGNMQVTNHAVSNFSGTADFWVDDKRLSNSSFRDLVGGIKTTVSVIKLDDLSVLDPVGFMKIDVEGEELKVLEGAEQLIARNKPVIMCEIYPKFNNGPVENTFEWLFDRGYRCSFNKRSDRKLHPVGTPQEGKKIAETLVPEHDGDFLFCPDNP